MNILRLFVFGILLIIITACSDKNQDQMTTSETEVKDDAFVAETSSEVPELWEFHDVIYQIWHEGWPEKNTTLLKELIPEIENGFSKLEKAPLPGILRDKKMAWSSGIQEMAEIIETYKKSAAADQKEALLKAAEDLHSQFEFLVRLVRPVMKEIDKFHQELYMLYHYYLPDYDLEKIKPSVAELLLRLDPIDKAKLPDRLSDKQQVFNQAKTDLRESLVQLQQTIKDNSEKDQVSKRIEDVHDKYQHLVGVFE